MLSELGSSATTSPCGRSLPSGFAAEATDAGAIQVSDAVMVPELTITADGAR